MPAPSLEEEFYTQERCHILEILNRESDERVSLSRARVEPGVTTVWHLLKDVDERYLIEAGVGQVEVGDASPAVVRAGDLVSIPANTRQRISNIGDDDLTFLCICTPRFRPEVYVDLED